MSGAALAGMPAAAFAARMSNHSPSDIVGTTWRPFVSHGGE